MANTNESFIDEVAEAVRRERMALWFRRWGWMIGVAVLAIIGTAAFLEWREARAQAAAESRGDAILAALETGDADARLDALAALSTSGGEGIVAAFLLAAEQAEAGEAEAAVTTLNAVAIDGEVPPLYRDLASLKALMIQGPEADRDALEALAAPGAPFRLLAQEQMALLDLEAGRTEEATATLRAIVEDAEVGAAQRGRVTALLAALGQPVGEEAVPEDPVPAPVGE